MPGEIACPWLLKKGGKPHNLEQNCFLKMCLSDLQYTNSVVKLLFIQWCT
jgi:hypothetical protein